MVVLYQDDYLLVIDKPAGLVVAPTETQKVPTLADIVRDSYFIDLERAGIVHRIDKDTSGLLLVAKTPEALENLQSQFKNRTVKKEYLALVHGVMDKGGVINAPIGRNPQNREKFVVLEHSDQAREAITEYEPKRVLVMPEETIAKIYEGFSKIQFRKLSSSNYQNYTLVTCRPLTGRTHQIRVHLKYIGFPIVSDERYVGRKMSRLDKRWCPRQFLHAAKISFDHPKTGERLTFESPIPDDLKEALGNLKLV